MSNGAAIRAVRPGLVLIEGELTFGTVAGLYAEAIGVSRGAEPVSTVDLAAVTRADSAGLALLLEWQAILGGDGHKVKFANVPSELQRLAVLCEADELLDIGVRSAA
jgi:phospholipid transport system transporter-binding protein